MRAPCKYDAYEMKHWDCEEKLPGSKYWRPARPYGWRGVMLIHRIKLAWLVFIGRYDALDWESPQ